MRKSDKYNIPVWHKYFLTPEEAAEYFGIGVKKIYRIIHEHKGEDFLAEDGVNFKIKRVRFEQFLDDMTTL